MAYEGVLTVTVTPFDADGAIDFAAYERLIDFVIANGVHYVVPLGTTGEYYALTPDEKRQVMRFVAERVGDRATLLAGANAATTAEVLDQASAARDLGYGGLLLASPYYSLPTAGELVTHFKTVAESARLPIMLYNFPARAGVDMSPEVLAGLRGVENIVAIKESSGSIARLHELLVDFADDLEIVCGADDQALEYFVWGVRSWVAGASNFLPAEHVALYDACVRDGDFARGREIMAKLLPLFMFMELGGKYIQLAKLGCELAGVPVGNTRAPLRPVDADERRRFAALYERAVG